jgi:hypothetical protein
MKNYKIILGLAILTLSFVSCKNEDQDNAQLAVEDYTNFVDSISQIATSEALANWEIIQADLGKSRAKAEVSLEKISDNKELQTRIEKVSFKYDEFKNTIMAEKEKAELVVATSPIRIALFGKSSTGNDMKFDWVNKDNIASIYENFVTTVQKNKDAYSREDWDEIKILYEALDTRKNTVEQQGLTSSDNTKIAGLKLKFAPMYTLNRMGAKSEENSKAKK